MAKRPLLWIGGCLGVLTIASLVAAAGFGVVTQNEARERWAAEALSEAEVDALIAAQTHLNTLPAFAPPDRSRDAGPLINPYLRLDGGDHPAEKEAFWATSEALEACRKDRWRTEPEALPQGDLSITAELAAFDSWDTAQGGAFADYLANPDPVGAFEAPIPNAVHFQTLAKLRLGQGLASGDPENMLAALRESRQLARISMDGEFLVTTAIAIAVLGIERKGFEAAVERGILPADAWVPVSDPDTWLARRTAFGMVAVYAGLGPPDARARLDAAGAQFGRCSALAEVGVQTNLLGQLITPALPGEDPVQYLIEDFTQARATGNCRLHLQKVYDEHPEWGELDIEALTQQNEETWLLALARLPWYRRAVFHTLRRMGQEPYVSHWRQLEREASR